MQTADGQEQIFSVAGFYRAMNVAREVIDPPVGPLVAREVVDQLGGNKTAVTFAGTIPSDQVEILSAQIQTVAPEALVVQSSDISNVRQRALQNLFIFVVAVTSFAFIAAVVLITNMVSLTLAERRRAFAIQKAIGFSRGQVLIMLVLEYTLLGLTAAGGAIGALVVTTALINTLQPSAQLVFPPELSLLIATITIATAALSAILVTWRTVHVPPLEALREH